MFRQPLWRDPLVLGWAVLMASLTGVLWTDHLVGRGPLRTAQVVAFLRDFSQVFSWSFILLLVLAWLRRLPRLRARAARRTARRTTRRARRAARRAPKPSVGLPWTDRWMRDWREEEAQRRAHGAAAPTEPPRPVVCRHGVPADAKPAADRTPVLRALLVSHTIVHPGSEVAVTWCFENAADVVVDGRPGQPPCGEALVRIDRSRRVEVVGRNRRSSTPVATPTVVAMAVPQLDLPTLASPPPVSLRTDVAATVGGATPVTRRLDDLWETQERLRPRLDVPARLVGVPASLVERLRRARTTDGED